MFEKHLPSKGAGGGVYNREIGADPDSQPPLIVYIDRCTKLLDGCREDYSCLTAGSFKKTR